VLQRTAHSHGVHGLFRVAADGIDSRQIPVVHLRCCSCGHVGHSRASSVLTDRSAGPSRSSRFAVSTSRIAATIERRPSWASLLSRVLVPTSPGRGLPTSSLGIRPRNPAGHRHCCRSCACSWTSPPLRRPHPRRPLMTQAATPGFAFRLRRFARPCRFAPPIVRLAPNSSPPTHLRVWTAKDSRACCIPLPILGFAAFRLDVGVPPDLAAGTDSTPRAGHLAMVRALPMTRTPAPRSAFRTPRRIPSTRSRVVSPRPLPP
jgi:hypothetical protein